MEVKNFLFHRVSDEKDNLWDPMDVDKFERCIKYLTNRYEVCLIEELYLKNNFNSKKKYATVSFDDGYKDNIDFAVPILKKYNCPASFYIVTDCIDKNIPTWTYVLDYFFQNTKKRTIDLSNQKLPFLYNNTIWETDEQRINYAKELKPYLKKVSNEKRETVLQEIVKQITDVSLPNIMMDWNDVRKLIKDGFKVGSHTVTHPLLGMVTDTDRLEEELQQSAKRIEEETGVFPITISYPVGSYNEKVIEISKKSGYLLGLAVEQRFYNTQSNTLFNIPRVELYNESWIKTRLRISGGLELIKKVLRR